VYARTNNVRVRMLGQIARGSRLAGGGPERSIGGISFGIAELTDQRSPARRGARTHGGLSRALYAVVVFKHAASAAPRLDSRPQTPCGIIACCIPIDRSVSAALDFLREKEERETGQAGMPGSKKRHGGRGRGRGKVPVVTGVETKRSERSGSRSQKQRRIGTGQRGRRRGREGGGCIIDSPLERGRASDDFI